MTLPSRPAGVDSAACGQEEVYTALSGSATVHAGGSSYRLEPGVFIRIAPGEPRKVTTEDEPVQLPALGAVPGRAYAPPPFTKEGAALPG
jgi:mannose-6-phosphate isomerase-like protein (cupin superfamily)